MFTPEPRKPGKITKKNAEENWDQFAGYFYEKGAIP